MKMSEACFGVGFEAWERVRGCTEAVGTLGRAREALLAAGVELEW